MEQSGARDFWSGGTARAKARRQHQGGLGRRVTEGVGGRLHTGRARQHRQGEECGSYSEHREKLGACRHTDAPSPPRVNMFAERWGGGPGPLGVRTTGFQSCRQERGLLNLCLNLFSWVQTPWNLEPVIKLAAPWGACLYPQTGPGPPALRSTLAPQMRVDGWDW